MNIEYLKKLEQNPYKHSWRNESISIAEIQQLEQEYNNNDIFPQSLRELLFLAGKYCIVLDYGLEESQQDLQEYVRGKMLSKGKTIVRPFYVIDIYNGSDQFLFVYLDEGNDPGVYEAHYYEGQDWITKVDDKLSVYIDDLVERVKQGRNPF